MGQGFELVMETMPCIRESLVVLEVGRLPLPLLVSCEFSGNYSQQESKQLLPSGAHVLEETGETYGISPNPSPQPPHPLHHGDRQASGGSAPSTETRKRLS